MVGLCGLGSTAQAGDALSWLPPCEPAPAYYFAPLPESWRRSSGLLDAVERAANRSVHPANTRVRLLAQIRGSICCYPGDLPPQEYDAIMARTKFLPPTAMLNVGPRFQGDTRVWLGAGTIGDAGTSRGAQLTISFPDDGTQWGLTCSGIPNVGPNALNTQLITTFGGSQPTRVDRGREFIRSSLAAWRRYANLTFTEVADDNTPMTTSTTRVATRGDMRIGGLALGTSGMPLAYNALPGLGVSSCSGGDALINLSYFTPGFLAQTNNNFQYFRNTMAHEFGHGLGYLHSVPCNRTKLMEPEITGQFALLMPDEIRAAIRNYGDRNGDNHTPAFARNLGNLTTPVLRSAIEKDVGINGTAVLIPGSPPTVLSEDDYYRFTLDTPQTVTITVTPTGNSPSDSATQPPPACSTSFLTPTPWCQGAQQGSGCDGMLTVVDAKRAGQLDLQLLQSNGTTLVAQSTSTTLGVVESVTQNLPAGTYVIRVWDAGGAPLSNQVTQTYDLTVRVGTSKAPPVAIAGINVKRVRAGDVATFMGNHNSYVTEPGATITSHAWDLDGNGTFEIANQTQPEITYLSNGTYPVALRVTDSNGLSALDTIQAVVWGAQTTIEGVLPIAVNQGATVPLTIDGTNFRGVVSVGQITISGAGGVGGAGGVSVTGTPVVNPLGTRITGLSLVVSGTAPLGPRSITITNSDGQGASGTGVDLFSVDASVGAGACCGTDGSCVISIDSSSCAGAFQGGGTACSPNPCPVPTGACCAGDGSCSLRTQNDCTNFGGVWQTPGSACSPNPCPQPSVPCCSPIGSCTLVSAASCTSGGGTIAAGTVCTPSPCAPTVGACCRGSSCTVVAAVQCFGPNTRFAGLGVACNPAGVVVTPCCLADFNQDGLPTAQDIFEFLNAWFTSDPSSDFNAMGGSTAADIFDFLNAWFAGC